MWLIHKSNCAYSGCSKSNQEGVFLLNRMTFPDSDSVLRTNYSFRNRIDENYHNYKSRIEELKFEIVEDIPLDYIHVVLLGVVKRLLRMWLCGKTTALLPNRDVLVLNKRLEQISSTQPSEFQRKVRSLSEVGNYKATEFRTFVKYTGPFILKNVLPQEKYNNFLLLHVSICILCDPVLCINYNDLSKELLKAFVSTFGRIYGESNIVYNVHSLIHLPNDVKKYGNLDEFSAFQFESFMYRIKMLLRKNNQPLAQVCNRLTEIQQSSYVRGKENDVKYPCLKKKQVLENNKIVYRKIILKNCSIDNSIKNCWVFTKEKQIVCFEHEEIVHDEILIYGFEQCMQ